MIYKFSYFFGAAVSSFIENGFHFSLNNTKKQYKRTMYFNRMDKLSLDFNKAISKLNNKNCYTVYSFDEKQESYELIVYTNNAMWKFLKFEGGTGNYQHISLDNTSFDEKMGLLEHEQFHSFIVCKENIKSYLKNTVLKHCDETEKHAFENFIEHKLFLAPQKMEL